MWFSSLHDKANSYLNAPKNESILEKLIPVPANVEAESGMSAVYSADLPTADETNPLNCEETLKLIIHPGSLPLWIFYCFFYLSSLSPLIGVWAVNGIDPP